MRSYLKKITLLALTAAANAELVKRDPYWIKMSDVIQQVRPDFYYGVSTQRNFFSNPKYKDIISTYNLQVPGNECKFYTIQSSEKENFKPCDDAIAFAKTFNAKVRGHTLFWPAYSSDWFKSYSDDVEKNKEYMIDYVTRVLEHYKDEEDILYWDVINESVLDDSSETNIKLRTGSDTSNEFKGWEDTYTEDLFKLAREHTNPNVKLIYNDYNAENNNGNYQGKTGAVFEYIKSMREKDVPIDGVGLQMHISCNYYPNYDQLTTLIDKYAEIGVEVHITEIDVSMDKCKTHDEQRELYMDVFKACFDNENCKVFTVWGAYDSESWKGAENEPLPFDENMYPKDIYFDMLDYVMEKLPADATYPTPTATKPAEEPTVAEKDENINYIIEPGTYMIDPHWQSWSWGNEEVTIDDDGNVVTTLIADEYGALSLHSSTKFNGGKLHIEMMIDKAAPVAIVAHTIKDEGFNEIERFEDVSTTEIQAFDVEIPDVEGDDYDRISVQDAWGKAITLTIHKMYFVPNTAGDSKPANPANSAGSKRYDILKEGDFMLVGNWQNWSWGVEDTEFDDEGNFVNYITAGTYGGVSFKRSDSVTFGAGTLHFKAKVNDTNAQIQILMHTVGDDYFNVGSATEVSDKEMLEYNISVDEPTGDLYDRITIQDVANNGLTLILNDIYFIAADSDVEEQPTDVEEQPTDVEEPTEEPTGTQVVAEPTQTVAEPAQTVVEEPTVDPIIEGDNVYYMVKNGVVDPAWQNWSWGVESAEVDKEGNFANVLTAGEWAGISFKRSDSTLFGAGTLHFKAKADTAGAKIQIVAHSTAADEYFNIDIITDLSTTKMTEYSIEVAEPEDVKYDRFTIQDIYNEGVTITINNVYFVANPVADEEPTEVAIDEPIDEPTEVDEPQVEEPTEVDEPEVDPIVEGDNVYYIVKNGEVDPAWQNWSWGIESAEVDKDGNLSNVLTAGEWAGISFKRSDSTLFGAGTLHFKAKADTAEAVIQVVAHSTAADEYVNMGSIRDLSTTKMTEYSIEITESEEFQYDRFTIQDIYNKGVTVTINNVYFVAAEPETPETPEECWAAELGFSCCKTTTRVVLEDESGSWGVENDFWCGLVENKDDTCWSTRLGYPCCKENNVIYDIDENGSWGYENDQWCGIAKADESCEFSALGYACCPNARVVAKDEHKWGFVDGQWCGVAF